ncbi:MAG: esterase, partial [Rhodobacterales bacterium]|nr:esterase [Rhodobacterales bacterium]
MLINLLFVLAACKGDEPPLHVAPKVVSSVPANGAENVSVQTSVRWVFDTALNEATLAASVHWTPGVEGEVSWEPDRNTMVFVPSEDLGADVVYEVTIGPEAESVDGLSVTPTRVTFTTAGGSASGPGGSHWSDGTDTTTVDVTDSDSLTRTYDFDTDHPQRDGAGQTRTVTEIPGQMVLRSGHDVFDGLFALAIEEGREASVDQISDGGFRYGGATDCACFETGELWSYVWTRDTAYAADLGLAAMDATRARKSLEFKLAADKTAVGSTGLQIVQDTGTGGSWPVSTDRVVWALGASAVLNWTDGAERDAFRDLALEAAINTAEIDRVHVYNDSSGLYRGEQSFLDWREQTYPTWTAWDVRHVAESQSLSTNVGHWALLDLAARLSNEVGESADASRYRGWADDLQTAIDDQLWLDDNSGYATMIPNQLDPAPLQRLDWLGTSLAALHVAPSDHAALALASYPHAVWGPPVVWPQQPLIPIYHNRAMWPFVTAYGVRAGVQHQQDAVVTRGVKSLARGAALNLSNMENLEFLTGDNWVSDGDYSGPVVNSRRQLWSVAGYAGMVLDVLGIQAKDDGLHIAPYLPQAVRREWTNGNTISLHNLVWKGKTFDVELTLPTLDATATGALVADSITVDGATVGSVLSASELSDGSLVSVTLVPDGAGGTSLTEVVDDGDYTQIFSPPEPNITLRLDGANLVLDLDSNGEPGTVFDVWRDGVRVASDVAGGTWTDTNSGGRDGQSYCYAVGQRF